MALDIEYLCETKCILGYPIELINNKNDELLWIPCEECPKPLTLKELNRQLNLQQI